MKAFNRVMFRQKREDEGLTRLQLAKLLNVSKSAITHWENGIDLPSLENSEKIVKLFGEEVFGGEICIGEAKFKVPTEEQYEKDVKESLRENIDRKTLVKLEKEANFVENLKRIFSSRI